MFEYLFYGAIAWYIADKFSQSKQQTLLSSQNTLNKDTTLSKKDDPEYVRDDYQLELQRYNEIPQNELINEGIVLGEYDYYTGLQGRTQDGYLQAENPNIPNMASGSIFNFHSGFVSKFFNRT